MMRNWMYRNLAVYCRICCLESLQRGQSKQGMHVTMPTIVLVMVPNRELLHQVYASFLARSDGGMRKSLPIECAIQGKIED